MIYDYDLQFPVGKIDKDLKLDGETYVIGDIIDVPEFKIYDQ